MMVYAWFNELSVKDTTMLYASFCPCFNAASPIQRNNRYYANSINIKPSKFTRGNKANNVHKWKKCSTENTCYTQHTMYVVECLHFDKYNNFSLL